MNQKKLVIGAAVAYLLLLLVAAIWSWDFTASRDEFVKLLAAWIAALTSALGAAVSLIVLHSQQKASIELEQLKGDISKSVKAVEFGMGQTAKATEAVSAAMSSYYYALATLEYGMYEDGDAKAADLLMRQARARLLDLLPDAQRAFDGFWQVGANIQGELRKMAPLAGKQEAMKKVWRDYVQDFGDKMKAAELALVESQRKSREGVT